LAIDHQPLTIHHQPPPALFHGLLVLLALAAFAGVLRNGFVYDDLLIIHGNPFFTTRQDPRALLSPDYFTVSRQGSYRPMVTLTYMIDGALWGGGPFGFHLTNLLLHAANVLLLFELARRFGARTWGAFLGALLFAVHPAFTEVIAFPNYREDLLVLLFSLASLWVLDRGTMGPSGHGIEDQNPVTNDRIPNTKYRIPYSLLSALFYLFALLSKESGLGLLLFLFLFVRLYRPGYGLRITHHVSRLAPHLIVTVLYLILRFAVYGTSSEVQAPYVGGSFILNAFTMCGVALSYLPLILFPIHLRPEYLVSPVSSFAGGLAALSGAAALLVAAIWILRGRQKWPALGLGWFFAFLLPVLNLYPLAHPKAERYLYLPCAGLFLLIGAGLEQWFPRLSPKWTRHGLLGAAALIIISFMTLAQDRVVECRNDFRLWKAAVRCEPDSADAHNNLGMGYLDRDRPEQALREFQRALELDPSPRVELNLARARMRQALRAGELKPELLQETVRTFHRALSNLPEGDLERAPLHHGLALALRRAGRLQEALDEHRRAEALSPHSDEIILHHGITLQMSGQVEAAILSYQRALALFPYRAQTYYNLGTALERRQRWPKALAAYKDAIHIEPRYAPAQAGLAAVLLRMDRPQDSLKHFQLALARQPGRAAWRFNYVQALLKLGRADEAREQLKNLSPDNLPPDQRRALERLQEQLLSPAQP